MKTSILKLASLLAAAVATTGCTCSECADKKQDTNASYSNGTNQASMTAADGSVRDDSQSEAAKDGEVIAIVMEIDQHEVDAAVTAQRKQVNDSVQDFAQMMRSAHGSHKEETAALAQRIGVSPNNTDKVMAMKKKHSEALEKLSMMEGNEFARAYMDAMVKGHTDVLSKIDNKLLKQATNASLKEHLTQTRKAVSEHLERAKSVQAMLPKS